MSHQSCKARAPWRRLTSILAATFLLCGSGFAQTNHVTPLALRDAIHTALRNNRLLQIERINPELARAALSAAWGVYDPIFFTQADRENTTDTGGIRSSQSAKCRLFRRERSAAHQSHRRFTHRPHV